MISSSTDRKHRELGLSLLELLFALSLLTVVLVAFAAVYPSGYKLNRKSARATIAAKTAAAVAAEFQNLPFFDDRVVKTPPIPTLTLLDTATDRTNLVQYLSQNLHTTVPSNFLLRPEGIQILTPPVGSDPNQPLFAQIFVTVYWTDSNDTNLERSVTIATAKTDNRVGR